MYNNTFGGRSCSKMQRWLWVRIPCAKVWTKNCCLVMNSKSQIKKLFYLVLYPNRFKSKRLSVKIVFKIVKLWIVEIKTFLFLFDCSKKNWNYCSSLFSLNEKVRCCNTWAGLVALLLPTQEVRGLIPINFINTVNSSKTTKIKKKETGNCPI